MVSGARPAEGRFETDCQIGARVAKGEPVACIEDVVIRAPIDGCLRGLTHAGAAVQARTKVVEIDPRGDPAKAFGIAERPGKISQAVLAAINEHHGQGAGRYLHSTFGSHGPMP